MKKYLPNLYGMSKEEALEFIRSYIGKICVVKCECIWLVRAHEATSENLYKNDLLILMGVWTWKYDEKEYTGGKYFYSARHQKFYEISDHVYAKAIEEI